MKNPAWVLAGFVGCVSNEELGTRQKVPIAALHSDTRAIKHPRALYTERPGRRNAPGPTC